jgi:hypothetical protein
MVALPDIPDPPPNHRLRTLTVLATAAVLVASVAADSYSGGPVAARPHVFTEVVRACMRAHARAMRVCAAACVRGVLRCAQRRACGVCARAP